MPRVGRMAGTAVKLGVKYGPLLYEAARHGREPAKAAAEKLLTRAGARRKAFAHADTLVDGTVLRVYHDGHPVYIVFAGDELVAVHPQVDAPLSVLIKRADLSKRRRPGERQARRRRITRR